MTIGPLHVRRSVFIEASPGLVWNSFISFDAIHRWLGQGHTLHTLEPVEGGDVRLSVDIDGTPQYFGGQVLRVVPSRELSLEINWENPQMKWAEPMYWTYLLKPLYAGTLVEFFHHGFERLGPAGPETALDYEQGWVMTHLVTLREIVKG